MKNYLRKNVFMIILLKLINIVLKFIHLSLSASFLAMGQP